MREELIVIDQLEGVGRVKVRHVNWSAGNAPFPRCQWCKLNEIRMLVEIVQKGFTVDLIKAVCYCDNCNLATIVQFEAQTIATEEENQTGI